MKRIMVYGDSNSWGFVPVVGVSGVRYNEKERWPAVLKSLLGAEYEVIEENISGRATVFDDPFCDHRNGLKGIDFCLMSHRPLDMIIVMLGTNDLKRFHNATPTMITKGLSVLLDKILAFGAGRENGDPKLLIVSPPEIGKTIKESIFAGYYDDNAIKNSKALKEYYAALAEEYEAGFLAAADVVYPSDEDAIHLTVEDHRKLAIAVYEKVKEVL